MNQQEFLEALSELFGESRWPKPLHYLQGLQLLRAGSLAADAAAAVGTQARQLSGVTEAADPVRHVLGLSLAEIDIPHRRKAAQTLGQLLLGHCAERAFEDIIREEMQSQEFELRDLREGRSDTDYRLYNGRGRAVYRINIKFHGASFRRAKELVGLEPADCFALATYKIHGALQKQHEESLPYVFAIVGVRGLTAESVGEGLPSRFVDSVALIHQAPKGKNKRDLEDLVVRHLAEREHPVFLDMLQRIRGADWYVLSARRADNLLRQMLFERVFALRIRNFARAFGGAELDMHFSLGTDLIPLRQFLRTLREDGAHKVTTKLERGEY